MVLQASVVSMIGRAIRVFIVLQSVSEARVDYNHSRIYDEFDFKGRSSVIVDGLCKDSCHIFASITDESKKLASNILIQTAKGFVSVADVADLYDAVTHQKLYLEVKKTPSLTIINSNSQLAAGPLVLYVVNQAADYFSSAEVYEAGGFQRPVSTIVETLTVMSALPFTLTQSPHEGDLASATQEVTAKMSGFDAVLETSETCPHLYYLRYGPFPGFTMDVNGPIVSVNYHTNHFKVPPGFLKATIGISNMRDLKLPGWMSSPGFHGCTHKDSYRSSLYDYTSPFHGEISTEQKLNTYMDIITNTDADHPVVLWNREDGFQPYDIYDTGDFPNNFGWMANNWTVDWQPDGTGETHFMITWTND